jgi:DNA segregation ATPase FtsK/SpoIIIE, S-DNA-T family
VPLRVQGCFLADDEIDRVVEWCRNQAHAHYDEAITRFALEEGDDADGGGGPGGGRDELFREACDIVQQSGRASTSYLQRRLKIGYNRAARVMEELEDAAIVSAPDHAGNRKVL